MGHDAESLRRKGLGLSKLESIDRWFGTEQASVVSLSWLLFFCDLVALACLAALSPALRALPGIDPATLAKVLKLGAFMLPAWAAVAVLGRYTWDWGGAWRTALIWSVLAALIAVPLAAIHWSGSGISFLVLFIPVAVTMAAAFFGMRRGLLVWIFFTAAHAGLAVLEGLGVLPYAPLFPEVAQGIFGTPLSIFCGVFGAFAVTSVFMLASSWMVDALGRARAKAEHKAVLVDFTGYTCTNCRWMEANMFPRPEIARELDKFVRVRLYTDGKGELYRNQQQMELDMFGTVALPYYAVLDSLGTPQAEFLGMTRSTEEFLKFLRGEPPRATSSR